MFLLLALLAFSYTIQAHRLFSQVVHAACLIHSLHHSTDYLDECSATAHLSAFRVHSRSCYNEYANLQPHAVSTLYVGGVVSVQSTTPNDL
jgi:hypothetical protein